MSTLSLYDTEVASPLTARIRNLDYHYQGEQWVQDTATDPNTQNPKRWVVRWELTADDMDDDMKGVSEHTVLAIWTRPEGDTGFPSLTYTHPSYTGEWEPRPHKVFVAGTWGSTNLREIVQHLRDLGVPLTSTWHDNPKRDNSTPEARRDIAMFAYNAMDEATLIVAVPCSTHHLRGAHTEVGYAVGQNKPVVVVGVSGDLNTMTEHPLVTYSTVETLIHSIARRPHKKARP